MNILPRALLTENLRCINWRPLENIGFSSWRSTCKLLNAASKDKDLWKFCLYSFKVRLKVLILKLRSSERFKDSLSTKTLCMWSYVYVLKNIVIESKLIKSKVTDRGKLDEINLLAAINYDNIFRKAKSVVFSNICSQI